MLTHSIHMKNYRAEIVPADYSKKLAQRLRLLREESRMSQEAVAHAAGLSTYTYQKFEKGESSPGKPMNPRLFTLLALSEVFGISLQDLLSFDE